MTEYIVNSPESSAHRQRVQIVRMLVAGANGVADCYLVQYQPIGCKLRKAIVFSDQLMSVVKDGLTA